MIGACAVVVIPCCIISGYTSNSTTFVITFSLSYGIVCGLTYMVPIYNTWEWFPHNSGLTSGLVIGSVGLGAILFEQMAVQVCNPNNIQAVNGVFPSEVTKNVPRFQRISCWATVCMIVLVILLIFPAPKKQSDVLESPGELIESN
jgi:MFS family permease